MPELAGQIKSGTPMSERECYLGAIEHLRGARDCLRGIGLLRGDMRWFLPVRLLDGMVDRITLLMRRGGPPLLIMPKRRRE